MNYNRQRNILFFIIHLLLFFNQLIVINSCMRYAFKISFNDVVFSTHDIAWCFYYFIIIIFLSSVLYFLTYPLSWFDITRAFNISKTWSLFLSTSANALSTSNDNHINFQICSISCLGLVVMIDVVTDLSAPANLRSNMSCDCIVVFQLFDPVIPSVCYFRISALHIKA